MHTRRAAFTEMKMKKFLIPILTLICLVCLGFAAACEVKEPNYYTLTFEGARGVTYECEIPSGYEVKEGAEVTFKVRYSDIVKGEPDVKVNDTLLEHDENGVYKFIMSGEAKVSVAGIEYADTFTVLFDRGENRIHYRDLNGSELESLVVEEGSELKFTIDVSVYYAPDCKFNVLANTLILEEKDGVYAFKATTDAVVTVTGLEEDEGFTARRGAGSGTADDPYRIEKPIDLYYMSSLVSNAFYNGRFGAAHYKLMNDIDMKGEQLYMIGDGMVTGETSVTSYFAGEFDGNGHTISNYYISDTEIEQQDYQTLFMPYIGMFGLASANTDSPVEIHDLHLKNFTINVDGAKNGAQMFYVGGIVGKGIGVNITRCSAEGVVNANGPADSYFGYIGGIAGNLLSAYGSEEVKYNSSVIASVSEVEVNGAAGWIYAAGGIVGSLESSDDKANAYILNCVAAANVSGAIYTGGIVGYAGAYTSIQNSCFTGEYVEASSRVPDNSNYGQYAHSYAGGIAGYLSYDAAVTGCYSGGEIDAYAVAGANFAHKGNLTGDTEAAGKYFVEAKAPVILNAEYSAKTILDIDYAVNTLKWVAGDWDFSGKYPQPLGASAEFTLTLNYGTVHVGGEASAAVKLSGAKTMAQLYEDGTSGVKRFISSDSVRSYGYFFDEQLTQSVPLGYLPYGDVTLYAGFADYSPVAGRYYIRGGNGAYLELSADGKLVYRDGAFSHDTFYTFDGTVITLYENAAFEVIEEIQQSDGTKIYNSIYFSAVTRLDGGVLSIINIADGYNSRYVDRESSSYYDANSPLTAARYVDGLRYGSYSLNNTAYTFSPDGTGLAGTLAFIYTADGSELTVYEGGEVIKGVIEDGVIVSLGGAAMSAYDIYVGVWEKSAGSFVQYSFDGRGTYTLKQYESADGNNEKLNSVSGTYTVDGDALTTDSGVKVRFDGDGFLEFDFGGYCTTFYKQSSFTGEWKYFNTTETVTLTFNGMNNEGYGKGMVVYGSNRYSDEINYSVVTTETQDGAVFTSVVMYIQDLYVGTLTYRADDHTLRGEIYSAYYNSVRSGAVFCMYDDFRGEWISEELGVVKFNGLGKYSLGGSGTDILSTGGQISVNGEPAGVYSLTLNTLSGWFRYGGKTYRIAYDEQTKDINVTVTENNADMTFKIIGFDYLHGLTFISGSGEKYYFSGGGNLPDGGNVYKNGEPVYAYKITSAATEIYSAGERVGELTVSAAKDAYVLTVNSENIILTLANSFTGEWTVGGAEDGKLVVGKIGVDFAAEGTYLGKAVNFKYDAADNRLSFTFEGKTLYINCFVYGSVTELTVGDNRYGYGSYNICLQEERVGSLKGTYTLTDGSTVYLDGMNAASFANGRGTASIRKGSSVEVYTYRLKGEALILTGIGGTRILRKGASGADYEILTPDLLYNLRVGDGTENPVYYTFDGIGGATDTKGAVYTYEITSADEMKRMIKITLTDATGGKYYATYDYGGSSAFISVVPEGGTEKQS